MPEVVQSHCPRCNRRFTAQADTGVPMPEVTLRFFPEAVRVHCRYCHRTFAAQADTLEQAQALAVKLVEEHERECGQKGGRTS